MHHRLHVARHQRREAGQVLGHALHGCQQIGVVHQARDQANLQGPFGVDRLAHQQHVERPGAADQARQALRGAAAGNDAELALRRGKAGTAAGHAQIAAQRHLQPAAEADAVDGRDGRLRTPFQALGHALHDRFQRLVQIAVHHLGQVRAGGKGLVAGAGDGQHAHRRIVRRGGDGHVQLIHRAQRNRVQLGRTVDGDQRQRAAGLVQQVFVTHRGQSVIRPWRRCQSISASSG